MLFSYLGNCLLNNIVILYIMYFMYFIALVITNGPMNVTVCSGTKANISCGYTGVYDPFNTIPNWRIIKRNNNGGVISNETVSGMDILSNTTDGLKYMISISNDTRADGSYLSVGPVDDTYNNTSYQCIFTINDNIIESDTAGTITVIGMYIAMYLVIICMLYDMFIHNTLLSNSQNCVI